ncbi:class B sortase [Peptoniphilaceae bacterium SGI.131]
MDKRSKSKKWIVRIIELFLIIVILYNAYQIFIYFKGRMDAQKDFNKTKAIADKVIDDKSAKADTEEKKKSVQEVLKELKALNSDVVSYIRIADTTVDYPVVLKDNDYYLRRNLNGEYSYPGMIFMDEENKADLSDMNVVLYGHNLNTVGGDYAPMFTPLLKFEKKDYVESKDRHFIELFTESGIVKYQIFSAYYSNAYENYRQVNMDKELWVDYLNSLRDKSIQDFNYKKEFTEEDKIITLSTCDNITEEGRYVVQAIRVNE